jgi:hypothetical protein
MMRGGEEDEDVYIKLAEAASGWCEENLRGRSEYSIANTDWGEDSSDNHTRFPPT